MTPLDPQPAVVDLGSPEQPSQLTRIEATLNNLVAQLTSVNGELRRVDQRTTSAKKAAAVGVIVGAVGVSVAIGALSYGLDARATAKDIVAARSEARVSSCVQQNITTERQRSALVGALLTFVPAGQTLTPSQQTAVDRYSAEVQRQLPFRDCTPTGIDAYLSAPPPDPAVNPPTSTTGAPR